MKNYSYLFLAAFLAASFVPAYSGDSSNSWWSLSGIANNIMSCFSSFSTEAQVVFGGLATLVSTYMGYTLARTYVVLSNQDTDPNGKAGGKGNNTQNLPLVSNTPVVSSTTELKKYFIMNKKAKEAHLAAAESAAHEREKIERRAFRVLLKKRKKAEEIRTAQEKAERKVSRSKPSEINGAYGQRSKFLY